MKNNFRILMFLISSLSILAINIGCGGSRSANQSDINAFESATGAPDRDPIEPPPFAVTYSKPLRITKGGTYSGSYESMDAKVPAILIQTSEPVIIENSILRGRGDLIRGFNTRVTIRNSRGYGLNANVRQQSKGRFIALEDVLSVTVENNYFESTAGIYINMFKGDPLAKDTIRVVKNRARNIDGRKSNGAGGYLAERYDVQFLQFNSVRNVANVEIAWNEVINEPYYSAVEDNISLYSSSGLPQSPMQIHDNFIDGAYPVDVLNAKYSGGGIMFGDGDIKGINEAPAHVKIYKNQVLNTTNYGIAIAGGNNCEVFDNRLTAVGKLSSGQIISAQNVGIYVWDIYNGSQRSPPTFSNNIVRDNILGWAKYKPDGSKTLNNTWMPSCLSSYQSNCANNSSWKGEVTMDTVRTEYILWREKLNSFGLKIGIK